jgi:hypothetical protein
VSVAILAQVLIPRPGRGIGGLASVAVLDQGGLCPYAPPSPILASSFAQKMAPSGSGVSKPSKSAIKRAKQDLKKKAGTLVKDEGSDTPSSADEGYLSLAMDEPMEIHSSSASEDGRPAKLSKKNDGGSSASASAPAPAPADAAAPPIAPPTAPATPIAEPSLIDLLAAINNMSLNVGKRFDDVEARLGGNDKKMADASSEFQTFKEEVTAKFAAINASAAAGPAQAAKKPAPWAIPVAGSSAASSYYSSAAAPAAQKTPPWASPAAAGSVEFGRKVFALGFPRKLPRLALMDFWEEVKAKVPGHLVSEAKFQGGHAKTFGVVFPTREAARLFTTTVRDSALTTENRWVSPRVGEGSSVITFRMERTIAERDRGRALSKSWSLLEPLVRLSSAWKSGMKLITDTARGSIAIVTGKDMWELIELKPVGDGYAVTAFEANLLIFGVGAATVEAIRASSTKVADAAPASASSGM